MSAIKLTRFLAHQARMVIQKNKFFVAAGWKSAAEIGGCPRTFSHRSRTFPDIVPAAVPGHSHPDIAFPGHCLVRRQQKDSCGKCQTGHLYSAISPLKKPRDVMPVAFDSKSKFRITCLIASNKLGNLGLHFVGVLGVPKCSHFRKSKWRKTG